MTADMTKPADEPVEFAWLEEIQGERALAWVQERNRETLTRLSEDPRFEAARQTMLTAPSAFERMAKPVLFDGWVHEKLTLPAHPAGAWIRTPLAHYGQADAAHELLLDLRDIPAHEGTPCVWLYFSQGDPVFCKSDPQRCLLRFSVGGGDRMILREFDLSSRSIVDDGFRIDEPSVIEAGWLDRDTLFVLAAVKPDEVTLAGWPRIARQWSRGTALADAPIVFDAGACTVMNLAPGAPPGRQMQLVNVLRDFAHSEIWLLQAGVPARCLPLPAGVGWGGVSGQACGQLIFRNGAQASVCGVDLSAGSLAGFDLAAWADGREGGLVHPVFEPAEGSVLSSGLGTPAAVATPNELWYVTLENVRPSLHRARFDEGRWTSHPVPLPDWQGVSLSSADGDHVLLTVEGFVDPPQLQIIGEGAEGPPRTLKQGAPIMDLSDYRVAQGWATSRDGTRVPYFLLRSSRWQGPAPTMLYAYGGFGLSFAPQYFGAFVGCDAMLPWLAAGGSFVLANLRGGGELGPAWATAAQGANRQRAFDDLYAVAEGLMADGVTSAQQLAVAGMSNGGLLTSVALVQRPELFRAVLSGVPLTDMARFHKLLAGAAWISEYGNPDIPEQLDWLLKYSPLHQVRPAVNYPEALYYSSATDDRVHPGHARRMVAKLRAAGHSVLYYEPTLGGHAGSSNATEAGLLGAIQATYLMQKTGLA